MSFEYIITFEKAGTQIEAELWATPGWFKFSQCWIYENNPYVSKLEANSILDGSYIEIYVGYHNEEAYNAWMDEWRTIHNELRDKIFENLKSRDIDYTIYWPENSEIESTEKIYIEPLSSFKSKIGS